MIIGYRRVSGKLPLTADENGARGTWLEKRRAFIASLETRGHTLKYLSEPTANSEAVGYQKQTYETCDLLILEFGGNNLLFHKKAWSETFEIINQHQGRIIFLCDDPDLPFLWKQLPNEDYSRWTCAVNAEKLEPTRLKLQIPSAAKIVDTPFHALLEPRPFRDGEKATAIYFGRPNGRLKAITPYLQSGMVSVAGKDTEWNDKTIHIATPPQQKERSDWYRQWRACFAMYDGKHEATGWRTGRAYHALLAGIPVAAPRGSSALNWAWQLDSPKDLADLLKKTTEERKKIQEEQVQAVKTEFPYAELEI
jgi:hypothetical protein